MNMYALLFWKPMLPEKEWTPLERAYMQLTERFFKHESVWKTDVLIWLISRLLPSLFSYYELMLQNKQIKCRSCNAKTIRPYGAYWHFYPTLVRGFFFFFLSGAQGLQVLKQEQQLTLYLPQTTFRDMGYQ